MACDLNFIVKREGLLKVTGSHIQWKSGNILETLQDRNLTTGSDNHSARLFSVIFHICGASCGSSASAELFVLKCCMSS